MSCMILINMCSFVSGPYLGSLILTGFMTKYSAAWLPRDQDQLILSMELHLPF